MTARSYRIFISSPSDVRPERAIAERVVARLAREFAHHCEIKPVLWEREPLVATSHFQDVDNIPAPSTTDICVVVLWSRLGFPLPPDQFRGALSGDSVTGTEWEFEDALNSFRVRGLPDLLLYQKTAEVVASLSDDAALEESRRQKRLVTGFLDRWFRSADGASFTAASHVFATTAEFEGRLEEHLRALLLRRLQRDLGLAAGTGAITWTEPPWPALTSFKVAQAPIFFGRTRARNELRDLLASQISAGIGFVLVVGASGSGKSSLINAGLLPDLILPGMIGEVGLVRYGIMRPADVAADTLRGLVVAILSATALPELLALDYTADTLTRQLCDSPEQLAFAVRQGLTGAAKNTLTERGQARLVLVVDQMEELFTIPNIDAAARLRFVAALATLARSGLAWVVATLRADFFDRLEQVPELVELAKGGTAVLLPPSRAELVEIVTQPARAAGLRFEVDRATGETLDDVLVAAAARDPAALPLLSFALDRLWRQPRADATLTFAAYAALGELEGAIAQHAEAVVMSLPEPARAMLPRLLLGLVTLLDGEQQATSHTCRRSDLPGGSDTDMAINMLIEARLLIADEGPAGTSVRVAHEALLSRWPRLAELIEDSRETLAALTRLRADNVQWKRNGQPDDLLLPPGKRLAEGADILAQRRETMEPALVSFIAASMQAANGALLRRRRLIAGAFAVLSILLVAVGIGAWFGYSGQRAAQAQSVIAISQRSENLALALKTEPDPQIVEAVALSVIQRDAAASPRLRDRLLVAANDDRQRLLLEHSDAVRTAWFNPAGTRIATAGDDGLARIWDARTGVLLLQLRGHHGNLHSVAFSPDGRLVVTASSDNTARLWNAADGTLVATLAGHAAAVMDATFSPDGRRIVTASLDHTARVWDVSTGHLSGILTGHAGAIFSSAYSADGTRIVTASIDGTARVWDASSFAQLGSLPADHGQMFDAAFSPDGRRIVTAATDNTARIWDAGSFRQIATLSGHLSIVQAASFSADGRRIATASSDGTARVWDAASGAMLITLVGHRSIVFSAAFSPDGRRLVTASDDATARVWDIDRGAVQANLIGHRDIMLGAAFAPDGERVITWSRDNTARVWNARTGASLLILAGHADWVTAAEFSKDGRKILTSSFDDTARIWDGADGRQLLVIHAEHAEGLKGASFSPDQTRIATASRAGVLIWDASSGLGSMTKVGAGASNVVRFSPDGKRVAAAGEDAIARLFDSATGKPLLQLSGHGDSVMDIAFNPDGQRIITASADNTARIWSVAGGVLSVLVGHENSLTTARFSGDGRLILTSSDDGTVRVWEAGTGALLTVLAGLPLSITGADFSSDGRYMVIANWDGTARVLQVPDYIGSTESSFIRAIAAPELDSGLRARYALSAPPPPREETTVSGACGTPASMAAQIAGVSDVDAWTRGAKRGSGACNQRLAELEERREALSQAFFYHARAAKLFDIDGNGAAAQHERYRRQALAWLLPRPQVAKLMEAVDAGKPDLPFPL